MALSSEAPSIRGENVRWLAHCTHSQMSEEVQLGFYSEDHGMMPPTFMVDFPSRNPLTDMPSDLPMRRFQIPSR